MGEIERLTVENISELQEQNKKLNDTLNKIEQIKITEVIEMLAERMDRGYEDEYVETLFIAKDSLKKLEKIEQIINEESEGYIQNNPCLREIREVLEKE